MQILWYVPSYFLNAVNIVFDQSIGIAHVADEEI